MKSFSLSKNSDQTIEPIFFWWLITLFIKLILVSITPLTSDEHYYWVWSQNLQLSYYDHPPFVAWLFYIGNFLPKVFLKWPAVFFGHLFFLIWDKFLQISGFTFHQRSLFFILSILSPLIGMSGLAITPDLPVMVFMGLLVLSFHQALNTNKLNWYLIFGLSLGLGFTSKYHIVLLLPGMFFYLLISKKIKQVNPLYLILSFIPFLIGSSPVFVWNALNDWASFKFQLNHGLGERKFNIQWMIEYFLSIIFIATPFLITNFFSKEKMEINNSVELNEDQNKNIKNILLYFKCSFIPIIILFAYSSLKNKVEANWTQAAFPFIFSYLTLKNLKPIQIKLYSLFWGVSLLILISQWNFKWIPNPKSEKLIEPFRYEELLIEQNKYKPFYVSSYQMASYLWFMNQSPVYKVRDMSRIDLFDTFKESIPTTLPFYIAKFEYTYQPSWFKTHDLDWIIVKRLNFNLEIVKVDKRETILKEKISLQ